jgi:transcriptional regulator with XRE-family HTH domain
MLLVALLGMLTNVGTSLLPTSWTWTTNRPLVWGAVILVLFLIVILTVLQTYLFQDNRSTAQNPDLTQSVAIGGGFPTIVHNANGTVVIHSAPMPPSVIAPVDAIAAAVPSPAVGPSARPVPAIEADPSGPVDEQSDAMVAVGWGHLALPTGRGLNPLLPETWDCPQVREAVQHASPGTVIAFARHAHGLRQDQLGELAGLARPTIGDIEAGGDRAHDVRTLRNLQRLLGIPPQLLGLSDEFVPLRPGDARQMFAHLGADEVTLQGRRPDGRFVPVAVDRQTLMSLSLSAALGAPSVDAIRLLDENHPVDPDMLHRLLVIRRLLNESDNWLGPGSLLPTVHKVYELTDRARRNTKGELRQRLLQVAALYAEFAGWLLQESGDLPGARAWTEQALQQAHAVDDNDLTAYSFVRLGQLAEIDRDDDRVIGMGRAAQRCGELTPQVQALALQQEARGHAIAGNETSCLTRFDEAHSLIKGVRPRWTDEYEVGFFFEETRLNAQRAACLLELGRPRDAIATYQQTLANGELVCRWERGVHLAKLAQAHAVNGEPEQATTVAFQALELSQATGTRAIMEELRRLRAWSQLDAFNEALDALDDTHPPASSSW